MDWREAAAGGLPAPRDDEPASLRQNILDELADHLDCALARELSKNITPEEAIANVKRRFGEPRDLARRLWVDAMKDTIMSKRLTLAAMALMTVMCLSSGWIAWSAHRASQETAESITRANGALIAQLSALLAVRPAPAASAGPERADVHFHLICDDAQKSPAKGFSGKLYLSGAGSSLNPLLRTSDEQGNLDFGMLPAGSYILRVTAPWNEFAFVPVEVSPAFPITSPIICPARDWQPADVQFDFEGLPSLKDRDALIVLHINAVQGRMVGASYSWMHDAETHGHTAYDVVLDPNGHLLYFSEWTSQNRMSQGVGRMMPPRWGGSWLGNAPGVQLQATDQFSWLAAALNQKPQPGFSDRRYEISSITVLLAPDIRSRAGETPDPSHLPFTLHTQRGYTPIAETMISLGNSEAPPLQPVHGQKNVWRIHLSRNFSAEVDRLLMSSASRLPDAKDAAAAKAESTTGADLLKTLGIATATPDHTADGLTGLKLGAIADKLPAKYAGFQEGDLLLGVNGWNVNNDRELGVAARGYPLSADKARAAAAATSSEESLNGEGISPLSLVALVRRGTEMMLYEVKPPGSPAPKEKKMIPVKPAESIVVPGGFRNRRRLGSP
jgi:hypothetical protein